MSVGARRKESPGAHVDERFFKVGRFAVDGFDVGKNSGAGDQRVEQDFSAENGLGRIGGGTSDSTTGAEESGDANAITPR